jgi:hypothetical protein
MCMKEGRGARWDGFRTNGQNETAVGRERATRAEGGGEREETFNKDRRESFCTEPNASHVE